MLGFSCHKEHQLLLTAMTGRAGLDLDLACARPRRIFPSEKRKKTKVFPRPHQGRLNSPTLMACWNLLLATNTTQRVLSYMPDRARRLT